MHQDQINPSLQFPEHEQLNCPRCNSNNTKFCYYNNYNLSQPRYFCKNCRRYWTKGGTLRKIPVGGGTRKITTTNKRSSNLVKKPISSPAQVHVSPAPEMDQVKTEGSSMFGFGNITNGSGRRSSGDQNSIGSGESSSGLNFNLSIFTSGSNSS